MDIILGLALTMHLGSPNTLNETHPYVEVQHESLSLGVYYNSIEEPSFYLTYMLEYKGFYAEVGAVTGYKRASVLPYGRVGYNITDNIGVFAAPSVSADGKELKAIVGIDFSF